jgi:Flp pilus assembly protein protease CpaA
MTIEKLYPLSLYTMMTGLAIIALLDVMHDQISNKAVVAVALGGVAVSTLRFFNHEVNITVMGILAALGLCICIFAAFAKGMMGGGAAKLLIALLFWFDYKLYMPLFLSIMCATLVSVVLWKARMLNNAAAVGAQERIPFGLSIALGTLYPVYLAVA